MKTTSIILCMTLTAGLMIGALSLDYQQHASAQMGMGNMMMNPNMMGMMNPGMMGNMMMNPGMMGNMMMNPGMMGNMMMNPNMMGMMGGMMNPNMTKSMMGMLAGHNITGSIKLLPAMMNAVESQIKVRLGDAVTNAEKELGNNSRVIAAHVGNENGYLVYIICGIDKDSNLHRIIVDPGDGKILLSQEFSIMNMMNMMGGMMNPNMMMGGMMNPNMMNMMGGMMNPNMTSHMWR